MLCEKCGQEILEDEKFCPYCGNKAEQTVAASAAVSPENEPEDIFSNSEVPVDEELPFDVVPTEEPEKKKKSPLLWIIPIVLAVLLVIFLVVGGILLAVAGVAGVGIFAFFSNNKKTDLPTVEVPGDSIVQVIPEDNESKESILNKEMFGFWYLSTGTLDGVLEIGEDGSLVYREGGHSATSRFEEVSENKIKAEISGSSLEFEYISGILVAYENGFLNGQIFTRSGITAEIPEDILEIPYSLSELSRAIESYDHYRNLCTACEMDFYADIPEGAYDALGYDQQMWYSQLVYIKCCTSIEEAREHCHDYLGFDITEFNEDYFVEYFGSLYNVMPAKGYNTIDSTVTDDMVTRVSYNELYVDTVVDDFGGYCDVRIYFEYIDSAYKITYAEFF